MAERNMRSYREDEQTESANEEYVQRGYAIVGKKGGCREPNGHHPDRHPCELSVKAGLAGRSPRPASNAESQRIHDRSQ